MAKKSSKRDGSKSEAVRKLIAAYPKLTAKQIHEGLTKQGMKVSLALVNKVKYTKPKPQRKQTKRKATTAASATPAGTINVDSLIQVKGLVDSLGGIEQTKTALELLAQLSKR